MNYFAEPVFFSFYYWIVYTIEPVGSIATTAIIDPK